MSSFLSSKKSTCTNITRGVFDQFLGWYATNYPDSAEYFVLCGSSEMSWEMKDSSWRNKLISLFL